MLFNSKRAPILCGWVPQTPLPPPPPLRNDAWGTFPDVFPFFFFAFPVIWCANSNSSLTFVKGRSDPPKQANGVMAPLGRPDQLCMNCVCAGVGLGVGG